MIKEGEFLERRVMDMLIKTSFEAKKDDFQHREDVTEAMYDYLMKRADYKQTLRRIGVMEEAYDELYKLYTKEVKNGNINENL